MSRHTVTLLDRHADQLRTLALPEDGHEGAAYVLLRCALSTDPWDNAAVKRYLSREVIPVASEDVISSSEQHIRIRTRTFSRVLRLAAKTDCVPAFVHGHPGGFDRFSSQDDADEPGLSELAQNRNGTASLLVSMVFTGSGSIFGRIWQQPGLAETLDSISVIGKTFQLHHVTEAHADRAVFHRQELAFGSALNRSLSGLRIGIIGCGATGSAVAMLLARLGARRLLLIDKDTADTTNLNRLLGASPLDVGRPKVDVVRDMVDMIGLGGQVHTYCGWVGDFAARDLLKSCDVLFGCTDDHDGRLLLNRFAHFYLVPVIDMGIGIDVAPGASPTISHAESRVTVVVPGTRCLLCRGVVDPALAREDDLERSDSEEYARRRADGEAYIRGGGLLNPAVITFTTGVACMAVDELIHRLTGYRRAGSIDHRVVKHHLSNEKRPGPRSGPCPICLDDQYRGLGDANPFLDRVG